MLNVSGSHNEQHIDKGTILTIEKVMNTNPNINGFTHFFKGATEKFNNMVYVYPNEIIKIN